MIIESRVFDRIEQTFVLFKNNFKEFFLPIFIYKLLVVIVGGIYNIMLYGYLIDFISNFDGYFNIIGILYNSNFIILFIIYCIYIALSMLLWIPFLLGLIKSINDIINNNKINIKSNIGYGINNIKYSFKTYWYYFSYIGLLPSIFFIFGGLIFISSYFFGLLKFYESLGLILMLIGVVLFTIMLVYRAPRAIFYMISAVDDNKFTKLNFKSSIIITNNNWWRIVGNFLLLFILINLINGFLGKIIGFLDYTSIDILGLFQNNNIEYWIDSLTSYITGKDSLILQIITGFLNTIMSTISSVFVIIFTYILYLRLKDEYSNNVDNSNISKDKKVIENKKIEL